MGNGRKTGKKGGNSGQSAGFGEDSRGARDARWAQQRFNGGGGVMEKALYSSYTLAWPGFRHRVDIAGCAGAVFIVLPCACETCFRHSLSSSKQAASNAFNFT
jgi:hypothetical protein